MSGGERGEARRRFSDGVDAGPDEEGWETFVIEGGLDLGELEDSEMSSGEGSEEASGEVWGEGEGEEVEGKGEGWETFAIEGGLDLDLDEDDLEARDEWGRCRNPPRERVV
jgi:hypothetical protein